MNLQLFALAAAAAVMPAHATAKNVVIDVDTSTASRLLQLTCSNETVDAAEFASSESLRHQLQHHRRFGDVYTIDNYVAGVRAIAACRVPEPDPFRMRYLVEQRPAMQKAINFLRDNRVRISREVAALLDPYVPTDMDFKGNVVLAPASFSRGGFASGGAFFIDIPGLAADVEDDYGSIVRLIAHETYHSVQDRLSKRRPAPPPGEPPSFSPIRELFDGLEKEGTATLVGDPLVPETTGQFGAFDQAEARRGQARLRQTADMLNFAVELLESKQSDDRLSRLYTLVFGGQVGQPGYYLGEQMAKEIAAKFGAAAIPCLLRQQPEYFVLAYRRAYQTGAPLKASVELGQTTLDAAQRLAGADAQASLDRCTPQRKA